MQWAAALLKGQPSSKFPLVPMWQTGSCGGRGRERSWVGGDTPHTEADPAWEGWEGLKVVRIQVENRLPLTGCGQLFKKQMVLDEAGWGWWGRDTGEAVSFSSLARSFAREVSHADVIKNQWPVAREHLSTLGSKLPPSGTLFLSPGPFITQDRFPWKRKHLRGTN